TEMILTKNGDFDPNLRLLFSHSSLAGGSLEFPPFNDITEVVEKIEPIFVDPTRLKGSAEWSPLQVTCAIQSEAARDRFCGGCTTGSTGRDADRDGCSLGAASALLVDCNDQIEDVCPGAKELCNGLDDNCDGHVDEGDPPPPPVACSVAGLLGAC